MITEDYVSFETAKLLKEKGFDEKCRYVYNNEGKKITSEHFMEGESFVDKIDIESVARYDGWNTYLLGDYAYLCPTIQMAMKWLRKEHNIFIDVLILDLKDGDYSYVVEDIVTRDYLATGGNDSYDTFEEAAEVAIKYCLENLI